MRKKAWIFIFLIVLAHRTAFCETLAPAVPGEPGRSESRIADTVVPIPSAGRIRKVLVIGIDGLRPDALARAKTPNLDSLIAAGSYAPDARTDVITRSGPGWTSVFTAVWSPRHGVRDNAFEGWRRGAHPTFFARLREARPGIAVGAVVAWPPIGAELIGADGFWMAPGGDDEVAAEAARLIRSGLPDVLFAHFDDVDHAGHRFGFRPRMPFYLWAVERVDRRIGELRQALREREAYGEEWLVVATTDHGGSFRHHGKDIPPDRTVFLLASGPETPRQCPDGVQGVVDVAPTVFAWLGLNVPEAWGWEGRPFGTPPAGSSPDGLAAQTAE